MNKMRRDLESKLLVIPQMFMSIISLKAHICKSLPFLSSIDSYSSIGLKIEMRKIRCSWYLQTSSTVIETLHDVIFLQLYDYVKLGQWVNKVLTYLVKSIK